MRINKLLVSNILLSSGIITSPVWVLSLSMGTVMANDSDQFNSPFQVLGMCSIWVSPFVMAFSLGHNLKYKQYNPFISKKLPLIPLVSYVGIMSIFFMFPKKSEIKESNNSV